MTVIRPTYRVSQTSLRDLKAAMFLLERNTARTQVSLNNQAAILAINSATKATEPGKKAKVSKLQMKFKLRPLVKMPPGETWYRYERKDGKVYIWRPPALLPKQKGLTRVTKAVKIWGKKEKRWKYSPWLGPRDKSAKIFKIPHYGAAKAGWLGGLKDFNKLSDVGPNKGRLTRVVRGTVKKDPTIEVSNLVKYLILISPLSADIGMRSAGRQMRHIAVRAIAKLERRTRL